MSSTEIRPFRIEISEAELDDLKDRLAHTRWSARSPARAGAAAFRPAT